MNNNNNKSGISSGATFVTSTLGNGVGGIVNTAGTVVGAAGRGVGDTVTGVTGKAGKPVGDGIKYVTDGVEDGATNIAGGVKKAGEGK